MRTGRTNDCGQRVDEPPRLGMWPLEGWLGGMKVNIIGGQTELGESHWFSDALIGSIGCVETFTF